MESCDVLDRDDAVMANFFGLLKPIETVNSRIREGGFHLSHSVPARVPGQPDFILLFFLEESNQIMICAQKIIAVGFGCLYFLIFC